MNLVINASEALGDAAGEIHLRTRLGRPEPTPGAVVHAFDLPDGDCVCLEVADTGSGMDAATLARVFDPFFTTKFTGRGLGLAATIGIVRTHRGALVVTSAPGRGSTFRLFLPALAAAPTPEKIPDAAPSPPAARGGLILIVDDEPAVLKSADLLLRSHGYQTVLANDGVEGLECFRANPRGFAAVLLDLTMPRLDGAEVLREIRALNPAARVLIMSGFSEQDILDRLRGLGPIAILHKPFTVKILLTRLGEVIAN
jgi:two-component system cell cycle sensor histidine kinase/response regulator CckA